MSASSGNQSGAPERDETQAAEATSEIAPVSSEARRFGKYRLLAELGRGGMADVHLAVAVGPAGFSKLQVIKRLRPGMTDIEEMRDMMLDEARLAARLNHKNIVQTNEIGIDEERYFLAMEYLDGQPYHRILKRAEQLGRTIPLPFAVKILCEVLSGLHYAHEVKDYDGHPLGVVHRDVSPQNVFVTYDGQVKVVDFGIAKAERRLVETQTGVIRGKLTYMAPEQAFGNEIDRRADIFSVGVMLWEAIAGERLWGQLTEPQIARRLMKGVPHVTTVKPDAPADLADLCTRALSGDPSMRPASAADMRAELEDYLATHDIQVSAEALGALTEDLFAEEHAELQSIVHSQLALLRVESETGERDETSAPRLRVGEPRRGGASVPPIPKSPGVPGVRIPGAPAVPQSRGSGPRAIGPSAPQPPDSMNGPTVPRAPSFEMDDTGSTERELSPPAAVLSNAPPIPGPLGSTTSPLPAPTKRRPRWQRILFVYGGAVLLSSLAAAIVGKVGFSSGSATEQASGGPPRQPSAPASNAVAAPPPKDTAPATSSAPETETGTSDASQYIALRIDTNPVHAKILFDGTPMPLKSSPFDLKLPKDGALHRITVEAPGFYPQSKMLIFDKDQSIKVFLSRRGSKSP